MTRRLDWYKVVVWVGVGVGLFCFWGLVAYLAVNVWEGLWGR